MKSSRKQDLRRLDLHARVPRFVAVVMCLLSAIACSPACLAVDEPQNSQMVTDKSEVTGQLKADRVAEDPNDRFSYVEDGEFGKKLNVPTYEWIPKGFNEKPRGLVMLIHGLTLHGKRYDVLGKAFASANFHAIAFDMRGYGKCFYDMEHRYCQPKNDCKRKVDYPKSLESAVGLARLLKEKYPGTRLIAIGESLGATPCLNLAADHPELVDALVLSGPAVQVNPMMVLSPGALRAGLTGLILDPKFNVKMDYFLKKRVSDDGRIVTEMEDDPMMRTKMSILDLIKTDRYVTKTLKSARKIAPQTPVLILQGFQDRCVLPSHVLDLTKNIQSDDQTIRCMTHYSHLLIETAYLKAATLDALVTFIEQHEPEHTVEMKLIDKELKQLGGKAM